MYVPHRVVIVCNNNLEPTLERKRAVVGAQPLTEIDQFQDLTAGQGSYQEKTILKPFIWTRPN